MRKRIRLKSVPDIRYFELGEKDELAQLSFSSPPLSEKAHLSLMQAEHPATRRAARADSRIVHGVVLPRRIAGLALPLPATDNLRSARPHEGRRYRKTREPLCAFVALLSRIDAVKSRHPTPQFSTQSISPHLDKARPDRNPPGVAAV
jgi:hypothetical protein